MGRQIKKWREKRDKDQSLTESEVAKIVQRMITATPSSLPQSMRFAQLSVERLDIDEEADLDPSQGRMYSPPNPETGQVMVYEPTQGQDGTTGWQAKDPTAPGTLTDGNAPASSPVATLRGGPGFIAAEWDAVANTDLVTYEVHISTTTGFTPGALTLLGETTHIAFFIKTLADGTALAYDTTYFVKIIAKDLDGAAAAGAEASGTMAKLTGSADIVAESVTAAEILADEALFNKLNALLIITNTLKTGETGQRVEVDIQGIRLIDQNDDTLVNLPTATGAAPTFSGNIIAAGMTVSDNFTLQGVNNVIDEGSVVTLRESVAPVTIAPVLSRVWFSWAMDTTPENVYLAYTWDESGTAAGGVRTHIAVYNDGTNNKLIEYLESDSSTVRSVTIDSREINGIARLGSHVYILIRDTSNNDWFIQRVAQATWTVVDTHEFLGGVQNNKGSLGTNGTHLYIVYKSTSFVRLYKILQADVDAGDFTEDTSLTTNIAITGLTSVHGFVAAEGDWWLALCSSGQVYAYSIDDLAFTQNSTKRFALDTPIDTNQPTVHGLGYSTTRLRFYTPGDEPGNISGYPTLNSDSSGAENWWIGYTWRDSVNNYESEISPLASIDMTGFRRNGIKITVPTLPAGADSFRVYALEQDAEPLATALKLHDGTDIIASISSTLTVYLANEDTTSAAPPTATTFPAAEGAVLKNERGTWQLIGDGSARGLGVVSTALRQQMWIYNECTGDPPGTGFRSQVSGAGAAVIASSPASEASHPGMFNLSPGTTATGFAILAADTWQDSGEMRLGFWVKTPGALSSATQRYTISVGPGVSGNNRIVVKYTDNSNGGAWELECTTSGVGTSTDPLDDNGGAVVVTANTWYFIEIRVTGSTVMVRINDIEKVDDFASNVPSGVAMTTGVRITKSVGTAARTFDVDAIYIDHKFQTDR